MEKLTKICKRHGLIDESDIYIRPGKLKSGKPKMECRACQRVREGRRRGTRKRSREENRKYRERYREKAKMEAGIINIPNEVLEGMALQLKIMRMISTIDRRK